MAMSNNNSSSARPPANSTDEATLIAKQTSLGHSLPGRAVSAVEVGDEVLPAREVGRY